MLCSSFLILYPDLLKIWLDSVKNQTCLPKFVLYAIVPSPGAKNGKNAGMMLNTVRIAVVVANSR